MIHHIFSNTPYWMLVQQHRVQTSTFVSNWPEFHVEVMRAGSTVHAFHAWRQRGARPGAGSSFFLHSWVCAPWIHPLGSDCHRTVLHWNPEVSHGDGNHVHCGATLKTQDLKNTVFARHLDSSTFRKWKVSLRITVLTHWRSTSTQYSSSRSTRRQKNTCWKWSRGAREVDSEQDNTLYIVVFFI